MRTRFVLSEMAIGLRRNLIMTIAMVVMVAISLVFLGAALLTSKQIDTMKDYWFDRIQVSVFLDQDVTQSERDAINAELHSLPQVEAVYYESKHDAFLHAQKIFQGNKALQSVATEDILPESYRVKLYDPRRYTIVSSAVQNMPGVDLVQGRNKPLEDFFHMLTLGQRMGLFIALVALAVAILLIFITVQQSAFSRRRETGIMRLVGASNLYIQAPFVLEGVVAGLLGGVLAIGGVALFKVVFIDSGVQGMFHETVDYIGWGAVVTTVPLLLVIGVLLAGITSFVTLQRYMRV